MVIKDLVYLRMTPIYKSTFWSRHSPLRFRSFIETTAGDQRMFPQKTLVDQVSIWLRLYDDGSVDRSWTGPPELKFIVDPVPPHDHIVGGVAVRDLTVDPASNLRVRVYVPEESQGKLPVFLHFHGGGFCITQADWYMYYESYSRLAATVPAICVSVYLPLAPERRLPAAIDEGLAALLWLCSLARGEIEVPWLSEHGDFNRVFLIGDSSGGNLVHAVAAKAGDLDLKPLKLAGGIPIHPGFMRVERSKSEMEKTQSPFLNLDMLDKFIALALPVGSTKAHPITCPMGEAAPPLEGLKLPPFLLCLAEEDLILDTEMEYYEAMKKAGKEVELVMSRGMGHSFYLNKVAVEKDPSTAEQTRELLHAIKVFVGKN